MESQKILTHFIEPPIGWLFCPIESVIVSKKGKKPNKLNNEPFAESIPYLDIKAIETGQINNYADKDSSIIISENELIVVWDGARSGWVGKGISGALGSTLVSLYPITVDYEYLYYFLRSKFQYINSNIKGTGIPHVDPNIFWKIQLPIAPFNEQKRIVDRLNELMSKLNLAQKVLNEMPIIIKEAKQKILSSAINGYLTDEWRKKNSMPLTKGNKISKDNNNYFYSIPNNWKLQKADDITQKITDGEHTTPRKTISGKMLLSAKNIRDGYIDYSDFYNISDEDFEKSIKRCNPEPGDVVIVCVGATIGRTAIVTDKTKFALVRSVALLKPNLIEGKLLMYFIQSPEIQNIIGSSSQGSAQPSLFLNKIKDLPIPLPPRNEQQIIIEKLDSLFNSLNAFQERYNNLKIQIEEIPQKLLEIAFSGQLVEQNFEDEVVEFMLEKIKKEKEEYLILSKEKRVQQLKKMAMTKTTTKSLMQKLKEKFKKGKFTYDDIKEEFLQFDDYIDNRNELFGLLRGDFLKMDFDKVNGSYVFTFKETKL